MAKKTEITHLVDGAKNPNHRLGGDLELDDKDAALADEPANTALEHDPEARMIAERVLALKEETQWDLPVTRGKPLAGEALKQWLLRKEDQSAVNRVERGVGYALLKRELGHGTFEGWLRDSGVPLSSARSDRQVAQLYMNLSATNRQRAVGLPHRKLQALASAPAPIINDLFDSGALDDAADMSREQLREIVRLRKDLERQREREDNLNETIARQQEELRRVRALPEMHQAVLELRRAVLDETEALRANAHTLQAVMDQVTLLPHDMPRAEVDAIVHPLMYALQGLHATAAALFSRGYDLFADYQADVDVFPPVLQAHEAARAQQRHTDFMQAADRRAVNRQIDLAPAAKRGRGRPRKGS